MKEAENAALKDTLYKKLCLLKEYQRSVKWCRALIEEHRHTAHQGLLVGRIEHELKTRKHGKEKKG